MQIDHYVLHPVPIAITSKYEVLKDSYGNPIYVNGIPLMHIPLRVEEESDYKIIPNKDVTGNLPLVLSESGLPGARYVLGMEWILYFSYSSLYFWYSFGGKNSTRNKYQISVYYNLRFTRTQNYSGYPKELIPDALLHAV